MIYVIVGQPGTGKTTVREYLESRGFLGFEASDYIKKAMGEYKVSDLQSLSEKAPPGIAARMIWRDISNIVLCNDISVVISGFRSHTEISFLKERARVLVIGLYADPLTCFERVRERRRYGDPDTLDRFYQERILGDYKAGLAKAFWYDVDVFIDTRKSPEIVFTRIDTILALDVNTFSVYKKAIPFSEILVAADLVASEVTDVERIAIATRARV